MTTAIADPTAPQANPVKKKLRLNPARRKSAKTKSATHPDTQPAENSPIIQAASTASSKKRPSVKADSHTALAKETLETKARTGPEKGTSSGSGNAKALATATPAMITGGLLGCAAGAAVLLGAGLWKNTVGVDSAILTARTAKLCMDNLVEEVITSLKAGTYSAPEAIDMLRRTTLAYASTIPGGVSFIERIFREVEMVRRQRGNEVDKVLAEACTEVGKAGRRGATAAEIHTLVFKQLARLSQFASNATQDVLARNPKFRPYMASAAMTLRPPAEPKVPTVRLNMALKHKLPRAATA